MSWSPKTVMPGTSSLYNVVLHVEAGYQIEAASASLAEVAAMALWITRREWPQALGFPFVISVTEVEVKEPVDG